MSRVDTSWETILALGLTAILLASACGSPPIADEVRMPAAAESEEGESLHEEVAEPPGEASPASEVGEPPPIEAEEPTAPSEERVETGPCPSTLIRLSHQDAPGLPERLTHARAFGSEDGRYFDVFIGSDALQLSSEGNMQRPSEGGARLEFSAVRSRRRALSPGHLRGPDSRRGALTRMRVVTEEGVFPFGTRIGAGVTLTEVSDERICGTIDVDDGRARVVGSFTAQILGVPPQ